LPPDAWAPRPAEPTPTASQPPTATAREAGVQPGSRTGDGSLGAKILAGLVLVPLLLGFCSNGSHDQYPYTDDGTSVGAPMGEEMPMAGDEPGSVYGVWVETSTDTTGVAPALSASPATVAVPAGAPTLRVEVVGADSATLSVEAFAGGVSLGEEYGAVPFTEKVHLDQRPASLAVTATDLSGTAQLQCRIYAGDRLVAIGNGKKTVTCTPEM
jgi:hypothetical protein